MKFIDEAKISVAAGNGGKGCISFRREKWVPRGGPDGGPGGKGGDIVFKVHEGLTTLMDLQYQKKFKAADGRNGKGSGQDGRGGDDVILYVPPGTLVYDEDTGECLADLKKLDEVLIAAHGGRGGKGNAFFTTATRQAPQFAQPGEAGEEKNLRLELKLLADVGLIGFPNAGKSTFLSLISKARPKIANYPFTTLIPSLGVVIHKSYPPFTIADLPGLIEGAHKGHGLGIQFLKHIERTRIFLHLISLGPDEMESIEERFTKIRKELKAFNPAFARRPQIVVLTKLDLIEGKKVPKDVRDFLKKKRQNFFAISAVAREGMEEVLDVIARSVATKQSRG